MAYYAALASLMELLDDIILDNRYPNFLRGKQLILKSLHQKLSFLQELLQDFSFKDDEVTGRIEERIRNVAYRVQDVIELAIWHQIAWDQARVYVKIFRLLVSVIQSALYPLKRFEENVEQLKKAEEEIGSIVEAVVEVKERRREEDLSHDYFSEEEDESEQASNGRNKVMVGYDEYRFIIEDELCGQSSKLGVISLVGTGGIGKTTLARTIFYDDLIQARFDCRVWVTISDHYNVKRVLQSILKSIGLANNDFLRMEEGELKKCIYQHLMGRRSLFVIDTIWNAETWDDLKLIFPDDNTGTRVMLTTRFMDVAQRASASNFIHEMKFLSTYESWDLLQENVSVPGELELMGRLIASKCQGLPLAIIKAAEILSSVDPTVDEWYKIAREVRNILSKINTHFSSVSLSYNHLPPQLKPCFLYMGIFPKKYEIRASNLIMMWIAEGFLKSEDESKSLEKVGEEWLEDLVKRNLVIATKKRFNGRFKYCVLHDSVWNFCRERISDEGFFHVQHEEGYFHPKGVENVRRISLLSSGSSWLNDIGNSVRSIHIFKDLESTPDMAECDSLKMLSVLCAHRETSQPPIRSATSHMFHLKYLAWTGYSSDFEFLSCISVLQNLQTLIINDGVSDLSLPPQVWKLKRLRHLMIDSMILPPVPMACNSVIEKLGCLQTLTRVSGFKFTKEAINMIPNLRKLNIVCWRDRSLCRWEFPGIDNLVRLTELEEFGAKFLDKHSLPPVEIPIAFPPNITKLSLQGCRISWKDLGAVGSLPNLQVLKLKRDSAMGGEWEPREGEFRRLKLLLLKGLDLKYWRADNTNFPRLESLEISHCLQLEEIPREIGDIDTLKYIEVWGNECVADSAILIQLEQERMGNYELQVSVYGV
ncbi:putative late blight resistance protein homolog R1A-10 [Andrographis paniculata]|uniref:putative late blight resistance protein homolog R1A-10 n=1 Tax=Andrographis paniculata TaxID=175694 RepID=UPI0021E94065|nr:putative late blight resistance protein homolog R1A-10 [Andrographis paniculata]